jgi:two-component sensor histidine kinase
VVPFAAQTSIDGANIRLSATDAQNFTLAVHKLATNAMKYGALSTPQGRVSIKWAVSGNGNHDVLKFQWRELGGLVVVQPERQGFGTSLLKAAFQDLRVEYAPEGLSCTLELPLRSVIATTTDFSEAHATTDG